MINQWEIYILNVLYIILSMGIAVTKWSFTDFVIHVKYHNIKVCIKESKWLTECKVSYPLGSPPASEGNMPGKVKVSGGLSSSVCKWSSVWVVESESECGRDWVRVSESVY